jgi:hypothetical protein
VAQRAHPYKRLLAKILKLFEICPLDPEHLLPVTQVLAAAGAELDAWGGPEGTPLHTAAAAGHVAAVKALLEAGADPDAASSSATTCECVWG